MNRFSKWKRMKQGSLLRHTCIIAGGFVAYILLIYLYNIWSSNIAFSGSLWPQICEWAYLGIELLIFLFVYAAAIVNLLFRGIGQAMRFGAVYATLTLGRQIILFLLNYFVFGLQTEDVWFQLLIVFIGVFLELLQYCIVFVCALLLTRRWERMFLQMRQYAVRRGESFADDPEQWLYPARELPLMQDPIRASALCTAVLVGMLRISSRLITDVSIGPAVDLIDALWMIAAYTFDVVVALASYVILLLCVRRMRNELT